MHTVDFDTEVFRHWLAQQTGEDAELTLEPIAGGASCEMFRMTRLGKPWMIRRAPLAMVDSKAHDVMRESRIMRALHGSSVPVPAVLVASDDREVLGAPFFIMAYIDGEVIRRRLPDSYLQRPEMQPAIGEELIDKLVALHAFDWKNSVIAELARPENYLERQVGRWMKQLARYRTRDLAGVNAVAQWLSGNLPAKGDLTVMHGDYKLDNMIVSRTTPPRILSLLDFEMTTVGDPLIDLAWAMIFWPEEGNLIAIAGPSREHGMSAEYCQTPQQLVQRYGDQTGRDLSCFQWYQAFSAWKLAIVLEGSYAKFLSGESKNPNHEIMGMVVDTLLARAQRFAV